MIPLCNCNVTFHLLSDKAIKHLRYVIVRRSFVKNYIINFVSLIVNVVDICCVQKDDKQPLLIPPAPHNKVSPHPDDETPEFKIDVSLVLSCRLHCLCSFTSYV